MDDYYGDFGPITALHSDTFQLGESIVRARVGDLTLLNWSLASELCGSLVP